MKSKLLALVLLAAGSAFGAVRFGVGVGVGVGLPYPGYYAPPPVVAPYAYAPVGVAPGYGYSWISPYYYPYAGGWRFQAGYWGRAPYAGARWIAPRYYGGRYYAGGWRRR